MGWREIHADLSKTNRQIIEKEFGEWGNEKIEVKIIDSAQVGTTIYTAHKTTNKETGEEKVWAGVFLTERNNKDYFNFSYKEMDETYGPCECSCPKRILDKLTPTDNKAANDWRKACRDKIEENKKVKETMKQLKNLPLGTKIRVNDGNNTICEHLIHNGQNIYKVIDNYLKYTFKSLAILGFEVL